MKRRRWLVVALVALSCRASLVTTPPSAGRASGSDVSTTATATGRGRSQVPIDDTERGAISITSTISGAPSAGSAATTLDDTSTKALLARLEPLPDLSGAAAPPLPPSSPPPPAVGTIEPIAFLAPTGKQVSNAPIAPASSLKPLVPPQITPRGEVTAEREIRVRFDEPMIAVAAVGNEAHPNVTIVPSVAGTWRWIDTRVLSFTTTAARFPAATELTVTVPSGVRALSGATLVAATHETFTTPAPSISALYPHVVLRPDSPLAIVFDQDIDPAQIEPKLTITGPDKRRVAVKRISIDEARTLWTKHPMVKLDPTKDLGRAAVIVVPVSGAWRPGGHVATLAKGAPSREGPRVSTTASYLEMEVAKPLSLDGLQCGDMKTPRLAGVRCPANDSVRLVMTNAVAASVHPDQIQIEGYPPKDIYGIGQAEIGLAIPEEPVGHAFTIRFGDDVVDVYGQPYVGVKRASFTTGPETFTPELEAPTGLYVLDPRFKIPQWTVRAESIESVRVELYRVTPDDYFAFRAFEQHRRTTLPGKQISSQVVPVGKKKGASVRVDLRPALDNDGLGHIIAIATARPLRAGTTPDPRIAWIEVTRLGVTARVDSDNVHAWVHDITPGKLVEPRRDVTTSFVVEGLGTTNTATTNVAGYATFALVDPKKVARDAESLLLVTSGGDTAFAAMGGPRWREQRTRDERWYVTDDRFMYRPGETVYVKGWLRWSDNRINPDIAIPDHAVAIDYSLVDSRGNKLAHGSLDLTDTGGFDVALALPANTALGHATLELATKSGSYRHAISVQEFRRPAFAVSLDDDVGFASSLPLIAGESIDMSVSAAYYAGGGLAGGNVTWQARVAAGSYQPPGWDRFTFEPAHPRMRHHQAYEVEPVSASQETKLSASSVARATIAIAGTPLHAPGVLTVDSNVTDVDRMTIRASSHMIVVHPSAYYVGLREMPETTNRVLVVVTDIDGKPVANVPVEIEITGVMGSELWNDKAKVMDTQHCTLTSTTTPTVCAFTRTNPDYAYQAVAQIHDARNRLNTAQYQIPWWPSADPKADLWITPDRKHYKPGDTAKLDIHSTVLPATAIVSFTRQGVIAQKQVALTAETTKVELPIEEAFRENVSVLVDRTGPRRRQLVPKSPPLPEHTQTAVDLAVDVDSARLVTTARALDPLVEPGANATFEVDVRRDNAPVANAEVALMVVDEAVLALSGGHHKNPIESFYRKVQHGTQAVSTIPLVNDAGNDITESPGVDVYDVEGGTGWGTIGTGSYGTMGHGMGGGGMSEMVVSRKDFRANAAFSPRLHTDATGKVRLTVKMPDSLTRFRVVALTASGSHYFGLAEGTIVTQLEINARTVAPRFANQGDRFSVPVVVQNLGRKPRTIDVAMRAANLVPVGPQGKRVTIEGGQRAEVRFDFATKARGPAVVQTIAVSGAFADASNTTFTIYEPATTESFATYGTVDAGTQFERVVVPKDVFPDVGGVEVTVASTQLQALTDAYWYLYNYPYECAEQRSARMLATQAVWDILEAFDTPGRPTKTEIDHIATNDLTILARDQRPDGGWGYFSGMQSDPFVTMQVTRALAGRKVRADILSKATTFVTTQTTKLFASLDATLAAKPGDRKLDRDGMAATTSLAATALTTLAATGLDMRARALHLHEVATQLGPYPVDAKARVLAIVASWPSAASVRAKLVGDLLSATHETAASATVATSYTMGEMLTLPSQTKTTALVLDAMIREAPSHTLITKLAHGLLDSRRGGRWSSTQDNLVVLSALRRYFDTYEKQTPNFTGKLWFGTQAYAEQGFIGRSTKRAQTRVGWTTLTPGAASDVAIVKDGTGRMYYRVGIDYAPKRADLPALDAGFVVRRNYAAVDRPDDVTKDKDGHYHIKLGARVVVTVETLASTLRHAVAVVDPMPAGFEAVNENLATSERAVLTHDHTWDFQDMRDTRVEAFSMQLREGSHRMSYTARATTPGTFLAAPAKAEEMYSPETFGRSTGETVVIE